MTRLFALLLICLPFAAKAQSDPVAVEYEVWRAGPDIRMEVTFLAWPGVGIIVNREDIRALYADFETGEMRVYDSNGRIDLDPVALARRAAELRPGTDRASDALAQAIDETVTALVPSFATLPEDFRAEELFEIRATLGDRAMNWAVDLPGPAETRAGLANGDGLTVQGDGPPYAGFPTRAVLLNRPDLGLVRDYLLVPVADLPGAAGLVAALQDYTGVHIANAVEGIALGSILPEIGVLAEHGFPVEMTDYPGQEFWHLSRIAPLTAEFDADIMRRWLSFLELDWQDYR